MRNKDEVAAKFVGCWEIGKRLIACLDAISQFCRGLRILNGRRGQSLCGHSFLTQRGRRVYAVVRSFYRRCFNRFQMSELEIVLELFAVHFALTGSGDSPRMGSGSPCGSPHVVHFNAGQ